jgi:ribose transport system permease protein
MSNHLQPHAVQRTRRPDSRPAATPAARGRLLRAALRIAELGPVLILALLVIALSIAAPSFFSEENFQNIGQQVAVVCIVSLGQLLAILTRGIDLSVGALLALCTVMGAKVAEQGTGSPVLVALLMLGTGAVVGFLNGAAYAWGRIPHPFIVTLATFNVATGLALVVSGGQPIPGMPNAIQTLGSGFLGAIPVPVLVVAGSVLTMLVVTTRTQWGRWIYAVGGNPDAAERVAIPTKRVLVSVYVISGLCVGLAAIVEAGRTNTGYPTAGQALELDSIAAVVIGGASFFGGRGGVGNALVGALIIGVLRNGLNLLNVSTFWQYVVIGAVVLLAVQLDVIRGRLRERFRVIQSEIHMTGGVRS